MKKINKNIVIIFVIILLLIVTFLFNKNTENYEQINIIEQTNEIINNTNEETEETDLIMVHIVGAVNQEGIVEIEEGSRIVDIIKEAGGAKDEADLNQINLAYEVEDGQKIYIPTKGENIVNQEYITEEIENNKSVNQKLNINKATQEELEKISGIGPSTAMKIIQYREENGKYKDIEEIKNIPGIGDNKFESIKEFICIK